MGWTLGCKTTVNHAVLLVLGVNGLLTLLALYATWQLVRLGQTWNTWANVLDNWNRQLPHALRQGRLLQVRWQIAQVRWHYTRLQLWQRRWHQVQRLISLLWLVYRHRNRWGNMGRRGKLPKTRGRRIGS